MFTPYPDKILIEPLKDDHLLTTTEQLAEKGIVLAVGRAVTFCKVGDVIYYRNYGLDKTEPDQNGKIYYVISCEPEFILGKESKKNKQAMAKKPMRRKVAT